MRKLLLLLAICCLTATLAMGQSSGNFTFGNTGTTHCVLQNNGGITGGTTCFAGTCLTNADCAAISATATCVGATATTTGTCQIACATDSDCLTGETCTGGVCAGGCVGSLGAAIKTNSGSGNVFLVRPSAVIGLLTNVSLVKNSTISIGTSSAMAGVDFTVTANQIGAPAGTVGPCVTPNFNVTYAARFVQISSNLFDQLGTTCTTVGPTGAVGCFFSFAESTVSAHSFDWIVGSPAAANPQPPGCTALSSGTYGITARWAASLGNQGLAQSLTCVGPVNLTVQQNKIFHFNTVN